MKNFDSLIFLRRLNWGILSWLALTVFELSIILFTAFLERGSNG